MRRAALLVVCALAATLGLSGPLPAAAAPLSSPYTGWVDRSGDPCEAAEAHRWLDEGVAAASKFFYDPSTNAWYWAEADGSIARNHDAYVPLSNGVDQELWLTDDAYRRANGKWVRLGADGAMVKGESLFNGGWYYFDPVTGAMDFEWAYLPHANKWVYYDPVTGRMWYGQHMVDGRPYYFDAVTGRKLEPAELRQSILSVREVFGGRKLTGIFQPHLYTRTRDFYKEFAESLSLLDEVILLDIYPARELPIEGVTSRLIYDLLRPGIEKRLCHKEELPGIVGREDFDVLMVLGAGDVDNYMDELAAIIDSKN